MPEQFDKKKQELIRICRRLCKHAARRLQVCEQELEKSLQWEDVYHEGILLQANLFRVKKGMKEIAIPDWRDEDLIRIISLDPLIPPHEQISKIFRVSKKRKSAIPHLEKQIASRKINCAQLEQLLGKLEAAEDEETLQVAAQPISKPKLPEKRAKPSIPMPYHEFYSTEGNAIRVGKGAKSNEQLTFRYSKGSDWWLHVRDYPGSHVILVVSKNKEPNEETIKDALQLALTYSKANGEKEAEISVTLCKYVHRLKVLTRNQLLDDVQNNDAFIVDRNIDVHIAALRKKLGPNFNMIDTVRGVGYRFDDEDE